MQMPVLPALSGAEGSNVEGIELTNEQMMAEI